MVNRKRVLTLTLASVCLMGTSFIRADYKAPMTLARGVSVTNLVVNKIGDRPQSYRSVVKIVDPIDWYENTYSPRFYWSGERKFCLSLFLFGLFVLFCNIYGVK